jgi:hypothetical protein
MLGTWEWLIAVFFVALVTWRFWPNSWRIFPRLRFSVRWLMAAVLVVGVICGGLARWYAFHLRQQGLIAQLHVQQQVTNSLVREAHADIAAAGRKNLSFLTKNSFGLDKWTEELDAYEDSLDGRRMPLISVEVSGGCDEDHLRPITIKISGASLEGRFVDRLTRAYQDRGWQHEVVPVPTAHE